MPGGKCGLFYTISLNYLFPVWRRGHQSRLPPPRSLHMSWILVHLNLTSRVFSWCSGFLARASRASGHHMPNRLFLHPVQVPFYGDFGFFRVYSEFTICVILCKVAKLEKRKPTSANFWISCICLLFSLFFLSFFLFMYFFWTGKVW